MNSTSLKFCVAAFASLLILPSLAQADLEYLITFEGYSSGSLVGHVAGTPATFDNHWVTITSGPYDNNPSEPTIAVLFGSNSGVITFDTPQRAVGLFYTSVDPVILIAYDSYGMVVGSATGAANYNSCFCQWDPLFVEDTSNVISYIVIFGKSNGTAIDDFWVIEDIAVEAGIEVIPGGANELDSPINLRSQGNVPVAVLSSADLDATAVDVTTVEVGDPRFQNAAGIVDATADSISIRDVNQDGLPDLVLAVDAAQLADAIDFDMTELLVTGRTTDSIEFFGTDNVRIIGN